MRSLQTSTVANARLRHSQAVLWLRPHVSAIPSISAFQHISSKKSIQVGRSFFGPSNTVSKRPLPHLQQAGQRQR